MIKPTFILAVIIFLITANSCKAPIVNCNGEAVMMQRNPEKQFQQYVRTTTANLKATADVLNEVKVDIDASLSQSVVELREKLDNYSSRTQDIIKAAFDAYNATPCDKQVRKAYFDLLENINKENTALEKLRLQLGQKDNNNDVKKALEAYAQYNGEEAFEKKSRRSSGCQMV